MWLLRVLQLSGFGGEKVSDIACGRDFTLFLTESGAVYACGVDDEGQLGALRAVLLRTCECACVMTVRLLSAAP